MTKEPNAHNYFNGKLAKQIQKDLDDDMCREVRRHDSMTVDFDGEPKVDYVVGAATPLIGNVLLERGKRYAKFIDNAHVSQMLKDIIHNSPKFNEMQPDQQEALDMICSKISRMVTGEFEYEDNLVDIIGYSQLVLDRIRSDKK